MIKIMKKISIIMLILITTIITTNVYAINLNLNVDFDGKTLEMSSETPEMKWEINNLQPDQTCETILTINSIGNKDVIVDFNIELEDKKELAEYLNIKIENKKTGENLYDGSVIELTKISEKIQAKQTNTYTIKIKAKEEKYSEVQNEKIVIKFKFLSKGIKASIENKIKELNNGNEASNNVNEDATTEENQNEEITTDIIKPIKAKTSYMIIIILAILIITLISMVILYLRIKKS